MTRLLEASAPERAAEDEHPAWCAWRQLQPASRGPGRVVALQEGPRNDVYCLDGAGPEDSDVIAKRGCSDVLANEHALYAQWLSQLPVLAPRCYGYLEEADGHTAWLFLERVRGELYTAESREHRALAGHWLATLHTAVTHCAAASQLPDRGPGFYRQHLRSAMSRLRGGLDNPLLGTAARSLVERLLESCERLDVRWARLEHWCQAMPRALVHGDLLPKNIRAVASAVPPRLLVFDWEYAGWGVPLVDLVQASAPDGFWASPDLEVYRAETRSVWPGLSEEDLRLGASVARLLHLLVWTAADASVLTGPWFDSALWRLAAYQEQLTGVLRDQRLGFL